MPISIFVCPKSIWTAWLLISRDGDGERKREREKKRKRNQFRFVGSDSLGDFADGFWFHKCKVPFEWTQWSTLKLDVLEHGHADPFTFVDVAQAGWFEVSVNSNATSSKVKVRQSETCWHWRSQGGSASLCLCHLVSFAPDDQLISSPEVPQPWVWWGAEGINMGTRFMATKEAQSLCIWIHLNEFDSRNSNVSRGHNVSNWQLCGTPPLHLLHILQWGDIWDVMDVRIQSSLFK